VHLIEDIATDAAEPVIEEPEFAGQRQRLMSAIAASESFENRK
jgi:hypothetical protein